MVWIAFSRFSGSAPENEMSLAYIGSPSGGGCWRSYAPPDHEARSSLSEWRPRPGAIRGAARLTSMKKLLPRDWRLLKTEAAAVAANGDDRREAAEVLRLMQSLRRPS